MRKTIILIIAFVSLVIASFGQIDTCRLPRCFAFGNNDLYQIYGQTYRFRLQSANQLEAIRDFANSSNNFLNFIYNQSLWKTNERLDTLNQSFRVNNLKLDSILKNNNPINSVITATTITGASIIALRTAFTLWKDANPTFRIIRTSIFAPTPALREMFIEFKNN